MNNRYKIGIAIALLLLLFNQAFIQFSLNKKENNAASINIAGKQRMLSQKINLGFYYGEAESGKLRKLFNEWKGVNNAFLFGDEELGIEKTDNKEFENTLIKLSDNIKFTEDQLDKAEKGESFDEQALYENQLEFLVNMNNGVKMLEVDSNQALFLIKVTEIVLMLFSMLVLILEVVLIYKPINNTLRSKLDELKQRNQESEKSNAELQRLNSALEEYSFITAHDLSEPVRKISVYTNELLESISDNDKTRTSENIKILSDSSKQLGQYFQGVLNLNAIDSHKILKKQSVSTLVNECGKEIAEKYPGLDYSINVNTKEVDDVIMDKNELPMLINEIIKNSFVFRIKNKRLEINVSGKLNDDKLELSFKDNGIGVDLAFEHKVFQIFQRLHGRGEYEGNGIGLALCKKIVESSGGDIYFNKEIQTGAELIVQLPLTVLD